MIEDILDRRPEDSVELLLVLAHPGRDLNTRAHDGDVGHGDVGRNSHGESDSKCDECLLHWSAISWSVKGREKALRCPFDARPSAKLAAQASRAVQMVIGCSRPLRCISPAGFR